MNRRWRENPRVYAGIIIGCIGLIAIVDRDYFDADVERALPAQLALGATCHSRPGLITANDTDAAGITPAHETRVHHRQPHPSDNWKRIPAREALDHPDFHIGRAKSGDAASAIALLEAVEQCSPLSNGDTDAEYASSNQSTLPADSCSRLPTELLANRLDILRAAMDKGSADAKLMYAQLLEKSYFSDPFAMGSDLNDPDEIKNLTEHYAVAAAHAGLREAYAFLGKSYVDGRLGIPDPVKAYSYLQTLSEFDGAPELQALLNDLQQRLSPLQLAQAEQLSQAMSAFCCVDGER